jgi:hypothetical protein
MSRRVTPEEIARALTNWLMDRRAEGDEIGFNWAAMQNALLMNPPHVSANVSQVRRAYHRACRILQDEYGLVGTDRVNHQATTDPAAFMPTVITQQRHLDTRAQSQLSRVRAAQLHADTPLDQRTLARIEMLVEMHVTAASSVLPDLNAYRAAGAPTR